MAKKGKVINFIANLAENNAKSTLDLANLGLFGYIQLLFVTFTLIGFLLTDFSWRFGLLFLLSFSAFTCWEIWRDKKRPKRTSHNLLFFDAEDEESPENYDEKAKEYYKSLGTKSFVVNRKDIVDSWDAQDPKPPWEQ